MDTLFIFGAKYLYIAAVLIIIWVFFAAPREDRKKILAYGIATLAIAFILDVIAGHLYFDARPFVVGNFTPLIPHAADNGFPSDHTILVASLAMIAWFYNRKISWVIWAVAVAVGISRVYVGVHHPIDIAGSIVLAVIGGIAARRILDLWHSRRNKPATPDSSSI